MLLAWGLYFSAVVSRGFDFIFSLLAKARASPGCPSLCRVQGNVQREMRTRRASNLYAARPRSTATAAAAAPDRSPIEIDAVGFVRLFIEKPAKDREVTDTPKRARLNGLTFSVPFHTKLVIFC